MTLLRSLAVSSVYFTLVAGSANAATIIFSEDFDPDPGTSSISTGGGGTNVFNDSTTGVLVSSADSATVDTVAMELDVPSFSRGGAGNRHRTQGVLVSLDAVAAGSYTLEFDVLNFAAGTPVTMTEGTVTNFEVNLLSGLGAPAGSDFINLRFGQNNNDIDVVLTENGAATATQLVAPTAITGDGTDLGATFALAAAGTSNDFLLVTWQSSNTGAGSSSNAFSLDNISIETAVPEPASLALLGLGIAGAFVRRRK